MTIADRKNRKRRFSGQRQKRRFFASPSLPHLGTRSVEEGKLPAI
jgi:hypothetical protein